MPLIMSGIVSGDSDICEAACDCICSILQKGMSDKLLKKRELIAQIDQMCANYGVWQVNEVRINATFK